MEELRRLGNRGLRPEPAAEPASADGGARVAFRRSGGGGRGCRAEAPGAAPENAAAHREGT